MALRSTDVPTVIDDVLRLMEQKCDNHNVEVIRRFEPNCPQVKASEEHLKQVFLNLANNASEASPEGGMIDWRLTNDTPDQTLSVIIHNSGDPISEDILDRLF